MVYSNVFMIREGSIGWLFMSPKNCTEVANAHPIVMPLKIKNEL